MFKNAGEQQRIAFKQEIYVLFRPESSYRGVREVCTLCVQKEGKTAKQCCKEVEECQGLRDAFYTCKRGQIDNTKRIRGNVGY
jgi:hypothetical protein